MKTGNDWFYIDSVIFSEFYEFYGFLRTETFKQFFVTK